MKLTKKKITEAWHTTLKFIGIVGRRLRLVRINRNFLVFLVFLGISVTFWVLRTLQETNNVTINYKLNIVGLPQAIIFTSELPDEIQCNISGRGFDILQYNMQQNSNTIDINFADIMKKDSKLELSQAALRRAITKKIGSSLQFISCTPSSMDIYYTTGKCKRVPVIFDGKVTTGLQHVMCGIVMSPDSVDVYAPQRLYDSIRVIHTEMQSFKDLEDTTLFRIALNKVPGAKIVPDSIDMTVCVDLFTEKTIDVPIYCENIPNNKVLRTFPPRANITFHVSATMYNEVTENDFIVVVDYTSIKPDSKSCILQLRSKPNGVSHVRMRPESVEFVIENEYE